MLAQIMCWLSLYENATLMARRICIQVLSQRHYTDHNLAPQRKRYMNQELDAVAQALVQI